MRPWSSKKAMEHNFFIEILIILTGSLFVVGLFRRVRMPPTLAYLTVGALIGPGGLKLISNQHAIEYLAEFGVVFLLFSLGLEFAFPRLLAMRRVVFGLGGGQVVVCTAVFFGVAAALDMSPASAFIVAGALALSSTAMVTRELARGNQLYMRFGQLSFAVLLFQDLASVFFLALIPVLSMGGDGIALSIGWTLIKAMALFGLILLIGRYALPLLFLEAARARSEEMFVLAVLVVVLATATLTQYFGLSMALGAFVAGMMLGESHYRHQIEAEIRPFRDVLLGIFFVSIGMLLDLGVLATHWPWVIALTATVMSFKGGVISLIARLFQETPETSLRTGLVMAQGGEFGFALLALAGTNGLIEPTISAIVLAAIILSMVLTPLIVHFNGQLARWLLGPKPLPDGADAASAMTQKPDLKNHVIICGFGRVGQAVARFLRQEQIPYVAVDADPRRVHEAALAGENVRYGDGRQRAILHSLGVERAQLVVVAFDDVSQAEMAVRQIRALHLNVPILVRTTDDSQWERLREAGATEVVPETLEGSLMLVSHVLTLLGLPHEDIRERVQTVRSQRYQLLHGYFHGEKSRVTDAAGRPLEIIHAVPLPDSAFAVGRTLGELGLEKIGVEVEALRRQGTTRQNPPQDEALEPDDIVILLGTGEQIERGERALLSGPPRSSGS